MTSCFCPALLTKTFLKENDIRIKIYSIVTGFKSADGSRKIMIMKPSKNRDILPTSYCNSIPISII